MGSHVRKAIAVAVVVVAVLVMASQPVQAQGKVHTVRRGDTLFSIAARYGTTVQAIVRANGLRNPDTIYAGQQLTIPAGGMASSVAGGTYTVRRGDTMSAIAARHGTTVQAITRANGLGNPNTIYAGQRLVIPGAEGFSGRRMQGNGGAKTYVVRPGDTLASVAYRHGSTVRAITKANGLHNPNIIYPGQKLRIPAGAKTAAPKATGGGKRIVVDLSEQRMYVYQNGKLLWTWVVSSGRPGSATAVGHYKVLSKTPNAYASTWNLRMPYWLGIYWAGRLQNGIHALPILSNGQTLWAGYLGQRVSFGCVILSTANARTLYNWASVGTPVDIVW